MKQEEAIAEAIKSIQRKAKAGRLDEARVEAERWGRFMPPGEWERLQPVLNGEPSLVTVLESKVAEAESLVRRVRAGGSPREFGERIITLFLEANKPRRALAFFGEFYEALTPKQRDRLQKLLPRR